MNPTFLLFRLSLKRVWKLLCATGLLIAAFQVLRVHIAASVHQAGEFEQIAALLARTAEVAKSGEFEPFSFLLRPSESLNKVFISAGDLKGPEDSIIPAKNVVVRSVEGFHGGGRDILMLLGGPWDMPAYSTEHFWCTIRVPDDAHVGGTISDRLRNIIIPEIQYLHGKIPGRGDKITPAYHEVDAGFFHQPDGAFIEPAFCLNRNS